MIPSSFKLQGHTIKVRYNNDFLNKKNALGLADFDKNEIILADELPGKKLDKTTVEHTFCHELVHHILILMNENELNENEKFVDVFGGLLHQAISTMKYPNGKKVNKRKNSKG